MRVIWSRRREGDDGQGLEVRVDDGVVFPIEVDADDSLLLLSPDEAAWLSCALADAVLAARPEPHGAPLVEHHEKDYPSMLQSRGVFRHGRRFIPHCPLCKQDEEKK